MGMIEVPTSIHQLLKVSKLLHVRCLCKCLVCDKCSEGLTIVTSHSNLDMAGVILILRLSKQRLRDWPRISQLAQQKWHRPNLIPRPHLVLLFPLHSFLSSCYWSQKCRTPWFFSLYLANYWARLSYSCYLWNISPSLLNISEIFLNCFLPSHYFNSDHIIFCLGYFKRFPLTFCPICSPRHAKAIFLNLRSMPSLKSLSSSRLLSREIRERMTS